jgi:hypothetical protein
MHDYPEKALRTEAPHEPIFPRLTTSRGLRLLHAALGLVSDIDELVNHTDATNELAEMGDTLWFINLGFAALGPVPDFIREGGPHSFQPNNSPCECLAALQRTAACFADVVKGHVIYGKTLFELDGEKIKIERELRLKLSTAFSLLLTYAKLRGYTIQQVAAANIAKLSARYPDKYTDEAALNRDTAAEDAAVADAVA